MVVSFPFFSTGPRQKNCLFDQTSWSGFSGIYLEPRLCRESMKNMLLKNSLYFLWQILFLCSPTVDFDLFGLLPHFVKFLAKKKQRNKTIPHRLVSKKCSKNFSSPQMWRNRANFKTGDSPDWTTTRTTNVPFNMFWNCAGTTMLFVCLVMPSTIKSVSSYCGWQMQIAFVFLMNMCFASQSLLVLLFGTSFCTCWSRSKGTYVDLGCCSRAQTLGGVSKLCSPEGVMFCKPSDGGMSHPWCPCTAHFFSSVVQKQHWDPVMLVWWSDAGTWGKVQTQGRRSTSVWIRCLDI